MQPDTTADGRGDRLVVRKESRMRVTANLDEECAAKLRRLQSLTQLSAAELVRLGIDRLDCERAEHDRGRLDALLSSGFVGCLPDAPEDLATNYKDYLTDALEDRHRAG